MAQIVFQVVLLSTTAALLIGNFTVPPGGLSVVCLLNGVLVSAVQPHFELLPVLVTTGVVADVAYLAARRAMPEPSSQSVVVSAVLGVAYVVAYWAAMLLFEGGTWWNAELWAGVMVTATLTGGTAGYLVGGRPSGRAMVANSPDITVTPSVPPGITAATVKKALEALRDSEKLAASPLARALLVDGPTETAEAEVRRRLLSAIEQVSSSNEYRVVQAGRLLHQYYVQRKGSHEVVAEELHISRPTFYRRLQDGLELVAQQLDTAPESRETSEKKIDIS